MNQPTPFLKTTRGQSSSISDEAHACDDAGHIQTGSLHQTSSYRPSRHLIPTFAIIVRRHSPSHTIKQRDAFTPRLPPAWPCCCALSWLDKRRRPRAPRLRTLLSGSENERSFLFQPIASTTMYTDVGECSSANGRKQTLDPFHYVRDVRFWTLATNHLSDIHARRNRGSPLPAPAPPSLEAWGCAERVAELAPAGGETERAEALRT